MIIWAVFAVYVSVWILQIAISILLAQVREKKKRGNSRKDLASNQTEIQASRKRYKMVIAFANGIEKWTLNRISKIPSHIIRNTAYKRIFKMKIGRNAVIYGGVLFRNPSKISIGRGTVIGDRCELDGRGGLLIGEHCNFSSEVHIWTAQHDPQGEYFDYVKNPVVIGNRCWISSNTIILPGVCVSDGAVLAAGAVLTKDADPYSIYGGVPAKKIGERNKNLNYCFDGSHDWFI